MCVVDVIVFVVIVSVDIVVVNVDVVVIIIVSSKLGQQYNHCCFVKMGSVIA